MDELEAFKSINLSEYAASKGYVLDTRASYNNAAIMFSGDHRIKIWEAQGKYFYVDFDTKKTDTVIEFAKKFNGNNLGRVRQDLRPWIDKDKDRPKPVIPEGLYQKKVKYIEKDRTKIQDEFSRLKPVRFHRYLASRHIETIPSRFKNKVFMDEKYKNAVFPHIDQEGVCCLEKRNYEFKGMSGGSEKGLWVSNCYKSDRRLVITEAPIDALSYEIMHGKTEITRYASFGGGMQEKQIGLLKRMINKMPDGSEIIIATDRGTGGEGYADLIKTMSENKSHTIIRAMPPTKNDWNEELKYQKEMAKRPVKDKAIELTK